MSEYKKIAKEFGMHLRFGKYGVKFFPRDPDNKVYKLVQVIPLDGWTSDPHEITQAMLDDATWEVKIEKNDVETESRVQVVRKDKKS